MTTENTQTQTAAAPTATPAPKPAAKKRTAKKPTIDYSASITGLTNYPRFENTIPANLTAKYPEFAAIANRLNTHGLITVKFFFTYSPDVSKPAKRTGDQFYITVKRAAKITAPAADYLKSNRHKITGKTYFKLFPEIKSLFTRIEKSGGGNFILNIAYADREKPTIRREHIIRTVSADSDTD